MYQVVKRDNSIVAFNLQKITSAIKKAFDACKREYTDDIIDLLGLRVTADFEPKIKDHLIQVEDIQDSVESILSQSGYADVAKAYILYRKQHENVRNVSSTILDYKTLVNSYVNVEDWRVKENSTVTYSVGGLILSNSGAITANYWLSEIYDEEIGSGKIGRSGVSLLDQWYTNLYCAVFKTETDGTRQIDFMDRMAMLWRLERDYRSIDDNPVNTGVQIYETVAVVFVLILLIGSSFSKWRQKKKN